MNSVWGSLLWKEWRELRWVLAAMCALLIAAPAICLVWRPGIVLEVVILLIYVTMPVVSMFLGMTIAAREQSTGTVRFLQALPANTAKPAAAKLFLAAVTIVGPIALGLVIVWLTMTLPWVSSTLLAGRDTAVFVGTSLCSLSLLLWMAAAGVNRSDEVRAGAIGFLVVVACWGVIALGSYLADSITGVVPDWFILFFPAAPGGPAITGEGIASHELPAGFQSRPAFYRTLAAIGLASHGALAWWFLHRFGRVVPGRRQESEQTSAVKERAWLALPRRSTWTAILWKQLRESGPLAIMSAATVVIIGFIMAYANREQGNRSGVVEDLAMALFAVWIMAGFLVANVAGVGVFMDDLKPGLHTFWRSRPISVNQWFWLKYLSALTVTILTLAIPPMLLIALTRTSDSAGSHVTGGFYRDVPSLLVIGLLLQIGAFCAAAAAMALVRQAVYAAVIALASVTAASIWLASDEITPGAGELVRAAAPLLALAVILAWLAVRNDWGWKR